MIVEERLDLGRLVTFLPNKRLPIHNWFYFKEAFSRDFVTLMLSHFHIDKGMRLLDPFCGVGTTLLTAKERGVNSVGIDADPLFVFVCRVKTRNYDIDELRKAALTLFSKRFEKLEVKNFSQLARRAFPKYTLEDIAFFKRAIKEIDDAVVRDFLTLALMVSAMKVSYAVKDGAVIKFFKKPTPPLKKVFKNTVKRWIRHFVKTKFEPCETRVQLGDARKLSHLESGPFDAIITSPPYLNQIDYTKVYAIEYDVFLPDAKVNPVETYLGLNVKGRENVFPELDLPEIARAYFYDMGLCLREMFDVLKDGGKMALVVAEGVFPDQAKIINSDRLLAKLAERVGFSVEKLLVVNKRVVTRERTVKIGEARESVLIVRK
jgi:tRNA G10  N-methylase Trm11